MFNRSTHFGQMSGRSGYGAVAGIPVALLVITGIILMSGASQTHAENLAHLYYAPIILSGFSFGAVGGVTAAIAAAILNHPAVLNATPLDGNPVLNFWLVRASLFLIVGATVGLLAERIRASVAQEQHQREQLDAYYDLDRAFLTSGRLDQVLSQLVVAVGELLTAETCSLYILSGSEELSHVGHWNRPDTHYRGLRPATTDGHHSVDQWGINIAQLACERNATVVCSDIRNGNCERDLDTAMMDRAGLRCVVAAPLLNATKAYGALCIGYANPCSVSDEAELTLRQIARRAAVTVKNSREVEDLSRLAHETLAAMSLAVEQRDGYTQEHVDRVEQTAAAVAERLGLDDERIRTIRYAAQLHDIGKLTTPTQILQKPGPLSEREWRQVEEHPITGTQILRRVSALRDAALLIRHHHERYDGGGYPGGLAGSEIPLGARIICVADAYDAMTSNRPYRSALSAGQAIAELRSQAGRQFDPLIVLAFLQVLDQPRVSRPVTVPQVD